MGFDHPSMKAIARVVLATALALGGCAAAHFDKVEWAKRVQRPPPGTALVYFIRPGPSTWGNAGQVGR
jgi:hypothetical protein